MGSHSLSNSFVHTINFTAAEYQKHQRLLYLGSVMSQFLTHSYFCETSGTQLSYGKALQEIAQFLQSGRRYSKAWDALARELQPIYDLGDSPGSSGEK